MSKYKIGDKVRVREWEDMAKEFIKTTVGIISKNGCRFSEDMKELCGKTYKIEGVWDETSNGIVRYKLDKCEWVLDDYMLENAEFCLDDLKDEMIVKLRNGKIYLSLGENFVGENGYMKKSGYNKSLKFQLCCLWDVVEVYPPSKEYGAGINGMLKPNAEPIWKEKKYIEIPEPDRTILENLDEKYKWIVRNNEGTVYVCSVKPTKCKSYWLANGQADVLSMFKHLFQFVRWEDEEPVNFREALKGE